MPDTGLISFAEMVDQLRNICSAVPELPVIADADTGFGNAMNVRRTVLDYAKAGAACIMIEDQVSPKRCGHFEGKQVVSREEARTKIRAAVEAAHEAGILVLARTDARAPHGFDAAMERCRDFEQEDADIVFLEAPQSEQELVTFVRGASKPTMANMVEEGKTPRLDPGAGANRRAARGLPPLVVFLGARNAAGRPGTAPHEPRRSTSDGDDGTGEATRGYAPVH